MSLGAVLVQVWDKGGSVVGPLLAGEQLSQSFLQVMSWSLGSVSLVLCFTAEEQVV